jgi:hypothetical protein
MMFDRITAYNRAAVVSFPAIGFAACCISLLASGLGGGLLRATSLTWSFGCARFFPLIAGLGMMVSLSDWVFPKKRNMVFISALILSAVTAFLGWALGALIREL